MQRSIAYAGGLAVMGDQLGHFQDRELGSALTSTARHLRFLTTAAVATSTATSSFDPTGLANGRMTVYLILPPDRLAAQAGLLRLWITTLLRAVVRTGLDDGKNVRFILDEAASLGKLDAIENAVTQLRGYGLKMLFLFQSLGQLKKVYPEGQDQTFLSNMDTQIYFGVNDLETAQAVSDRIGNATVWNVSVNDGDSTSVSRDPYGLPSHSAGRNRGMSAQEGETTVLRPEQVLRLPDAVAVVFAPGVPPLLTALVRHFDRDARAVLRPAGRGLVLARAVWLRLLGLGLAAAAFVGLAGVQRAARRPAVTPPRPGADWQQPGWPLPPPDWTPGGIPLGQSVRR